MVVVGGRAKNGGAELWVGGDQAWELEKLFLKQSHSLVVVHPIVDVSTLDPAPCNDLPHHFGIVQTPRHGVLLLREMLLKDCSTELTEKTLLQKRVVVFAVRGDLVLAVARISQHLKVSHRTISVHAINGY